MMPFYHTGRLIHQLSQRDLADLLPVMVPKAVNSRLSSAGL